MLFRIPCPNWFSLSLFQWMQTHNALQRDRQRERETQSDQKNGHFKYELEAIMLLSSVISNILSSWLYMHGPQLIKSSSLNSFTLYTIFYFQLIFLIHCLDDFVYVCALLVIFHINRAIAVSLTMHSHHTQRMQSIFSGPFLFLHRKLPFHVTSFCVCAAFFSSCLFFSIFLSTFILIEYNTVIHFINAFSKFFFPLFPYHTINKRQFFIFSSFWQCKDFFFLQANAILSLSCSFFSLFNFLFFFSCFLKFNLLFEFW